MRCLLFLLLLLVAIVNCNERWAIKLKENKDPNMFAMEHNLKYITRVGKHMDVFETLRGKTQSNFHQSSDIVWKEKQIKRKQYKRAKIKNIIDPLYSSQWHLTRINAAYAWDKGYTGQGITIGIVDDGVQFVHPDLAANYDASASWDFNDNDNNPAPSARDTHGTASAGLVSAAQNSFCGLGVAPNSKIAGIRLLGSAVYDYVEGQALSYKKDKIRIYSNSWGPVDAGILQDSGNVVKHILKTGFEDNTVFVWAGGNGRRSHDNVNYDGYANNIHVIAIGALNSRDRQSYYSESGACLFAVTPSSGISRRIITTGTNRQCNLSFGGTSAAAPQASGIIALLLEKHPTLTPRGVMHLIAKGSTVVDPDDLDWTTNSRGYKHNHKYGFGLMYVPKLIETAPIGLKPRIVAESGYKRFRASIPCIKKLTLSKKIDFIEHIEVTVSFYSNKRGRVGIVLYKENEPNVKSILAESRSDYNRGLSTWIYSSVRHWGSTSNLNDKWIVQLTGKNGYGDQLRGISIKVHGM